MLPKLIRIAVLSACLLIWGCDTRHGIQNPENAGAGSVALKFNFVGHALPSGAHLLKPGKAHSFTRVLVEAFSVAAVTEALSSENAIASAEIILTPTDSTFEARLDVPAVGEHLIVAKLYQTSSVSEDIEAADMLSFCGKTRVTIIGGTSVDAAIDLFAVPIRGQRVVFQLEELRLDSDESMAWQPISISNLDSLRGIQFDLILAKQNLVSDSVQIRQLGTAASFSNADLSIIESSENELQVRILMYDRAQGTVLPPIVDACAGAQVVMELGFQITSEAVSVEPVSIPTAFSGALVTTTDFSPIEVWTTDGGL